LPAYRDRVRAALDEILPRVVPELFDAFPEGRRGAVLDALQDGKRLRASLVCLVCEACGGTLEDALPRALVVECVHAASLIHDDFVDDDRTRREHPAWWTVEGARQAVLLGDVMFATAIERAVEMSPFEGAVIVRAIAATASGAYREYREGAPGAADLDAASYDRLIDLKTGALFEAAGRLGAMAGQAPSPVGEAAGELGIRFGRAYQIADDLAELVESKQVGVPPALARMVGHFDAGHRAGEDESRSDERWRKRLVAAMQVRIAREIEEAGKVTGLLPDNRFSRMLRELPAAAVAAQIDGSPPNDRRDDGGGDKG